MLPPGACINLNQRQNFKRKNVTTTSKCFAQTSKETGAKIALLCMAGHLFFKDFGPI